MGVRIPTAWFAAVLFTGAAYPLVFAFSTFFSTFFLFMLVIVAAAVCAVIIGALDSWAGMSASSRGALFGSLSPILGIGLASATIHALTLVIQRLGELQQVGDQGMGSSGAIFEVFNPVGASPQVGLIALFLLYAISAYAAVLIAIHRGEQVSRIWLVVPLVVFAVGAVIGWHLPSLDMWLAN